MDPVTLLLRLPLMPLQGVIKLGELVSEQVDREQHDPAAVRRRLEEAEEARRSGEVSGQDVAQLERQAVGRVASRQVTAETTPGDDWG